MVLIIGAGPAGTSCAISLLKAGMDVTILDREDFPRHAPGETLHPGIEPLLNRLEVWNEVKEADFTRHSGITNFFRGKPDFEPYHPTEKWQGFQLHRKTFDRILLDKASSLGGKFSGNTQVLAVEFDGDRITAVQTDQGSFQPDFVIDASGRNAILARKAGIKFRYDSPKLIAWYGYVSPKNTDNPFPENPQMIWDETGWTWLAKIKPDLLAWNRLTFADQKLPPNWLPEELKYCQPIGTRKASDVTWRRAERVSAGNYFLTGDAAFVLDPASSHGVLKAIMSGIMVAFLLQKVRLKEQTLEQIHSVYEKWISDWYLQDVEKLSALYAMHGLNFQQEANPVTF
jgi:flavin-dependent dehydrogenase